MPLLERMDESIIEAQSSIDKVIEDLKGWKATLHFLGVVGFPHPVDLFKYTKPEYREPKAKKGDTHRIKFDPVVYPPTEDGLHELRSHLSFMALQEGTALNSRSTKLSLNCFRCCTYKKPKASKKNPVSANLSLLEEGEQPLEEQEECDNWGVKFGVREYKFHRNNSFKRPGGLVDVHANTMVPFINQLIWNEKKFHQTEWNPMEAFLPRILRRKYVVQYQIRKGQMTQD